MFETELKDATGTTITEGAAATIDAYSGSIYAVSVYVVGTKGKGTVLFLSDVDAIEEYKRTRNLEGLPVNSKKHTRIIMCNLT
jgi:hypothetical protein